MTKNSIEMKQIVYKCAKVQVFEKHKQLIREGMKGRLILFLLICGTGSDVFHSIICLEGIEGH